MLSRDKISVIKSEIIGFSNSLGFKVEKKSSISHKLLWKTNTLLIVILMNTEFELLFEPKVPLGPAMGRLVVF